MWSAGDYYMITTIDSIAKALSRLDKKHHLLVLDSSER